MSVKNMAAPNPKQPFPTFASLAEAEAYSKKLNDAYFEICYHIEGELNLCLAAMHNLYGDAPPSKRPRMQTGIARQIICPEGWPKHPKTITYILVSLARYRHEDTCHAYTVKEAMTALVLEKKYNGTLRDAAFDHRTFEPWSKTDEQNARNDLLRLCDWIESRFHYGKHKAWYMSPDSFSSDPEKAHLANLGIIQRHLATFSERDRKRWEQMHQNAAIKHAADLRTWSTVGKAQHDPDPRTWTHPEIDALVIGLWPLVTRYNWTYSDLLKVLEKLLPAPVNGVDLRYPLDSTESLKVHCRTICGLTKSSKGKSAEGLPEGWQIAQQLFRPIGK
jgi:hypothetical protein